MSSLKFLARYYIPEWLKKLQYSIFQNLKDLELVVPVCLSDGAFLVYNGLTKLNWFWFKLV